MNSLRLRLFAAFLLIILAVILFVGLALLVILRNNPLVERQALTRLNEAARLALRQNPPPAELRVVDVPAYVSRLADAAEVRVLLTTLNGQILVDSRAEDNAPIIFPDFRVARPEANAPGVLTGRAPDAQRRFWLYITRPAGKDQLLVFATEQPRFAALAFFSENLLLPLVEAGAIAALLAAALAVIISRSIALPLQKMAGVAQGIARGDYSQAAPVSGPDEVRALGQSINTMSQQVQATQQTQRDFLANVSHELKTPLTSIQGFAQAIADGTVDSPSVLQRSAQIIYDEAQRMHRLVENLLDLARLDAGLSVLHRAPLDLRALLTTVTDKFNLRAQEKQIILRADLPAALPSLVGDADRLAQVFTNLLDNALKHTPAGGSVALAAARSPEGVVVTVTDTGPGIPPEDVGRIFERFYQVDKSRTRSGGLGLGLAITKEIVEAHGGRLTVASQPGRGAQFSVLLPVARPDDTTIARRHKAPSR